MTGRYFLRSASVRRSLKRAVAWAEAKPPRATDFDAFRKALAKAEIAASTKIVLTKSKAQRRSRA
jgi:hypothetical protein